MSARSELPIVKCPTTGLQIFMDAVMWSADGPMEIICPACSQVHFWDAETHQLRTRPDSRLMLDA
jgi:hypothetical protein